MKYFEQIEKVIQSILKLLRNLKVFAYDYYRFSKYSSNPSNSYEKVQLQARITVYYHELERGLSLKNPRKGFGIGTASKLVDSTNYYFDKYGRDHLIDTVLDVLSEWIEFNYDNDVCQSIIKRINSNIKVNDHKVETGGTISYNNFKHQFADFNYPEFVESRFSLRNFDDKPIDDGLIEKAVDISRHAPSACNRQPIKVHILRDKTQIEEMNSLQGGTRGFYENIDKLIILTADLSTSLYHKERNQHYVDGGIFAMNLLLALHWLGIGAVILNWATDIKTDKQIYKLTNIAKEETIIIRIAIGSYPKSFKVPRSSKKKVNELLIWH